MYLCFWKVKMRAFKRKPLEPPTQSKIHHPVLCVCVCVRVERRSQVNMEWKGWGGPCTLERARWVSGGSVPGHKEVVGVLACFSRRWLGCERARRAGVLSGQLCEVMCLERWWRSLKDSLQMGHLSFSSRRRFTRGSMAYSFLWCERMWYTRSEVMRKDALHLAHQFCAGRHSDVKDGGSSVSADGSCSCRGPAAAAAAAAAAAELLGQKAVA